MPNGYICLYTHKMPLEDSQLTDNTGCQCVGKAGNQGEKMRSPFTLHPLVSFESYTSITYYTNYFLKIHGGYWNEMTLCKKYAHISLQILSNVSSRTSEFKLFLLQRL